MLREGHYESATALAQQRRLTELVDVDMFMRTRAIETALLEQHDCGPALAWCEENAARLTKTSSALAFHLHQQIFLEVRKKKSAGKARAPHCCGGRNHQKLKAGDRNAALQYAKEHFPAFASEVRVGGPNRCSPQAWAKISPLPANGGD